MGLDIGAKRTGVALSDELKIIATPLETIATEKLNDHLNIWIPQYKIEAIVVGKPTGLSGGDSDNSELVNQIKIEIKSSFPGIPLTDIDERFTSKLASRSLVQSGMKKTKRREKGQLDKVSAALILQDYLNS